MTKVKLIMQWIITFVTQTLPTITRGIYQVLGNFQKHEWGILLGVVLYCYAIRFIHHVLDAGPAVLMLTALVGIFTIGLGDTTDGGVSAYSVFNRGFQRILGSIDVEALVAQHVGGVMGAGVAGVGGMNDHMDDDENRHGGGGGRRHRRGRRPPQEAAVGVARAQGNHEHNDHNNNNGDQDENDGPPKNNNNNNDGRSRKSGKKARRRNLEQRRELQQQRQAAMAMGFAGDGGGQDENMAMQRLLEEQIAGNEARAANEARGGDGN
eukprot:CAMPEP_0195286332 /NCGR_PEP_ID=MMETSP0707-20130614/3830_1 /TAXON_ID=33640 /ORGANISM="Asterionellopsis glacialis, Strain CCMP134" /LENGTH=265 /DNA_ID=CAMNT_0040345961 /DNA_START=279 /DNA_END=1076 /DNA_ORIENTATION=+